MAQQVLDAVAQCRGRRRAAGTGAFHVEIDDAILETAESDVAAVVGDRGANPGLDQLLDGGDCGGIRLVEEFFAVFDLGAAGGSACSASRRSSVPVSRTGRPGRNFIVAGFGVASV